MISWAALWVGLLARRAAPRRQRPQPNKRRSTPGRSPRNLADRHRNTIEPTASAWGIRQPARVLARPPTSRSGARRRARRDGEHLDRQTGPLAPPVPRQQWRHRQRRIRTKRIARNRSTRSRQDRRDAHHDQDRGLSARSAVFLSALLTWPPSLATVSRPSGRQAGGSRTGSPLLRRSWSAVDGPERDGRLASTHLGLTDRPEVGRWTQKCRTRGFG